VIRDPHPFLEKLQHILGLEMRVALVREALLTWSAEAILRLLATFIDRCVGGVPPGEDAQLAFIPAILEVQQEPAAYEKLCDVYSAAVTAELAAQPLAESLLSEGESEGEVAPQQVVVPSWQPITCDDALDALHMRCVRYMLVDPPPHRRPPKRWERFGPRWDRDRTLGERKALASGANRLFLEKLLYDADYSVVERLCRNPRIVEHDVLFMVTRRPNTMEILDVIAKSRWLTRYPVRHALALSPYSRTGTVLRLLPLLHFEHLEALQHTGDVHALVRQASRDLIALRKVLVEPLSEPVLH